MTSRRAGRSARSTPEALSARKAERKPALAKDSGQDGGHAVAQELSVVRAPKAPKQDVVLVTGPTEDGKGLNVLRAKEDGVQLGAVRPLEEGKPILGEVVRLRPRKELPALFDVETHLPSPVAAPTAGTSNAKRDQAQDQRLTSAGPAQVATDTYRSGWERIYKKPGKPNLPN